MDWQQSDSRLQISFPLKEIFSLLARGKRKRKKKRSYQRSPETVKWHLGLSSSTAPNPTSLACGGECCLQLRQLLSPPRRQIPPNSKVRETLGLLIFPARWQEDQSLSPRPEPSLQVTGHNSPALSLVDAAPHPLPPLGAPRQEERHPASQPPQLLALTSTAPGPESPSGAVTMPGSPRESSSSSSASPRERLAKWALGIGELLHPAQRRALLPDTGSVTPAAPTEALQDVAAPQQLPGHGH